MMMISCRGGCAKICPKIDYLLAINKEKEKQVGMRWRMTRETVSRPWLSRSKIIGQYKDKDKKRLVSVIELTRWTF